MCVAVLYVLEGLTVWEGVGRAKQDITVPVSAILCFFFFFQAEDGIRDVAVTGVQTCALPISDRAGDLSECVDPGFSDCGRKDSGSRVRVGGRIDRPARGVDLQLYGIGSARVDRKSVV